MRAAIFHENGGPEVVRIEDLPRPVAGPGKVAGSHQASGRDEPKTKPVENHKKGTYLLTFFRTEGANIVDIEACITRLRTEVENSSLVDQAALKAAGAMGVVASGNVIQVVVGPEADTIAEDIEDLM